MESSNTASSIHSYVASISNSYPPWIRTKWTSMLWVLAPYQPCRSYYQPNGQYRPLHTLFISFSTIYHTYYISRCFNSSL